MSEGSLIVLIVIMPAFGLIAGALLARTGDTWRNRAVFLAFLLMALGNALMVTMLADKGCG